MRGEIPQFKRCCMCLPLRRGLITWGYIRLVIGVILLVEYTTLLFYIIERSKNEAGYEVYIVLFVCLVIVAGADIVLNVVFVYSGHTKDFKMLKAYYIYSFILWILMIIMGVAELSYAVHTVDRLQMDFIRSGWFILSDIAMFGAQITIQGYVILLVRSEVIKLTRNCEFRFVNNAAESACEMKCEEDSIANGDITANTHVIVHTDTEVDRDIASNRNVANGVYTNGSGESIYTMTY